MPVPPHLYALLDDASVAPSGEAGLEPAVTAHREHRDAWYGEVVGPLVVADAMLPRLVEVAAKSPTSATGPLEMTVAVSGGAGALEPAVLWATRGGSLRLRALQVTMRESDAGDLAPNARRIVAAVDALVASGRLDEDVAVYVEPPPLSGPAPTASWLSALDELAAMDHRLTLRTDDAGVAGAAPSSGQLAACIDAALDRELRYRCTGLDRALRQAGPPSGAGRHGFLNVLLATRAGLDGAGPADMTALLQETDAKVLAEGTDEAALASAHRWLTSFDTHSVTDSLRDLVGLGWLAEP